MLNVTFLKTIAILLGGWLILIIGLYFFQEHLLFFPRKIRPYDLENIRAQSSRIEEINLTTPDGVKLHGWLVKIGTSHPQPLIIYFGGNAEEVSWMAAGADKFPGWSLALINYRGYGFSEGKPTQDNLFADSKLIYDYFAQRSDIDKNKIVVLGRSLGSGIAVYLAAQRSLKAAVLVSPYDSVLHIAQTEFFFAPVSFLLRHPFDSLSYAPAIKIPLLCLVAQGDSTIPVRHSKILFDAWNGKKTWHVIRTGGHNGILDQKEYWETIADFLKYI